LCARSVAAPHLVQPGDNENRRHGWPPAVTSGVVAGVVVVYTTEPPPFHLDDTAHNKLMANLPEGVKVHGINKYYGAQGVRKPLIPPIDESSSSAFITGFLHHMHCGFLRELMVYTKGPADGPRPFALGPGLIEGTCGSIKRIIRDQGNVRVTDSCLRAKIVAKEVHLRVDCEPSATMEKLVAEFADSHIESIAERKARLQCQRFEYLAAKRKAEAVRARTQARRRDYIVRVDIRFDTDGDRWPRRLLLEQAEGRGLKSFQNWRVAALAERIHKWDEDQTL